MSIIQIDQIISDDCINMETYGVSEMRDGFFDALFLKPEQVDVGEIAEASKATLPLEFEKRHPLSPKDFLPRQLHELRSVARKVTTTRAGINLLKSFTAFFIAYVLCLIPVVREWLGRYDYIMVVSVIINHPARTFGSQVDGAILTIVGTASGLAWGVVGLLLSTSTLAARTGYGGILAIFLALFMASIAYIRTFFIRFYQAVLCAGLAVAFTILAETNSRTIEWSKIRSYAIPWLLGQAIALVINCVLFPDAGNRPLAAAIDKAFKTMQVRMIASILRRTNDSQEALVIPRPRNTRLRRRLAKTFMDMSLAYRDMRIDITITRYHPSDVRELRNLVQGVVRTLLSMETETVLFEDWDNINPVEITVGGPEDSSESSVTTEDNHEYWREDVGRRVASTLSGPTKDVLSCMMEGMRRCHAALMDISHCRRVFGPPSEVSSDIAPVQMRLGDALNAFDTAEARLLASTDIPDAYADHSATVELFVFARHVREAATTIVSLMAKVHEMSLHSNLTRINLPTYPLWKAVYRTNAQVRHDRGGVTAGMYHSTFSEIGKLFDTVKAGEKLDNGQDTTSEAKDKSIPAMEPSIRGQPASRRDKLGYRIWLVLHRLQGFESRYAFKVAILTSVLALPAWISGASQWWHRYEAWWAVCMGWIMLHPRVGGNIQDLVTRASAALLGAAWSDAAYAAGNGNPFVMAAFAAVYMLPMIYRFTQSTHPVRSLALLLNKTNRISDRGSWAVFPLLSSLSS